MRILLIYSMRLLLFYSMRPLLFYSVRLLFYSMRRLLFYSMKLLLLYSMNRNCNFVFTLVYFLAPTPQRRLFDNNDVLLAALIRKRVRQCPNPFLLPILLTPLELSIIFTF